VVASVLPSDTTLHLTGRFISTDPAPRGVRLVIGDLRSGGFVAGTPGEARILVRPRDANNFRAGDGLSLTARLMPPPGSSEPGDSDFGRDVFFQGINAGRRNRRLCRHDGAVADGGL
jgi:competence protein ComEC